MESKKDQKGFYKNRREDEMREPGFVYKEYDRGAKNFHQPEDNSRLEETAETESHRPHDRSL